MAPDGDHPVRRHRNRSRLIGRGIISSGSDARVVVVADERDGHASAAVGMLKARHGVEAVWIDTSTLAATSAHVRLGTAGVRQRFSGESLVEATSVWWRRAPKTVLPDGLDPEWDAYRQTECDAFVQGLMWSVAARWVNDPGHDFVACRKVVQLNAAAAAGLAVPETLITNDPDEARAFIDARPGPVIFKRTGASRDSSMTRLIDERGLDKLPTIATSPTTFQDFIEPAADLRIVWMGESGIAIRIDSAAGAGRVDSRVDLSVEFTAFDLPCDVEDGLRRTMKRLGLVFGVIDMRCGTDGTYYFLEVNPQGQFAYLEILSGVPIFEPLSDFLVAGG